MNPSPDDIPPIASPTFEEVVVEVEQEDRMTAIVTEMMAEWVIPEAAGHDDEYVLAKVCEAFRKAVPRAFETLRLSPHTLKDFRVENPPPFKYLIESSEP